MSCVLRSCLQLRAGGGGGTGDLGGGPAADPNNALLDGDSPLHLAAAEGQVPRRRTAQRQLQRQLPLLLQLPLLQLPLTQLPPPPLLLLQRLLRRFRLLRQLWLLLWLLRQLWLASADVSHMLRCCAWLK